MIIEITKDTDQDNVYQVVQTITVDNYNDSLAELGTRRKDIVQSAYNLGFGTRFVSVLPMDNLEP